MEKEENEMTEVSGGSWVDGRREERRKREEMKSSRKEYRGIEGQ